MGDQEDETQASQGEAYMAIPVVSSTSSFVLALTVNGLSGPVTATKLAKLATKHFVATAQALHEPGFALTDTEVQKDSDAARAALVAAFSAKEARMAAAFSATGSGPSSAGLTEVSGNTAGPAPVVSGGQADTTTAPREISSSITATITATTTPDKEIPAASIAAPAAPVSTPTATLPLLSSVVPILIVGTQPYKGSLPAIRPFSGAANDDLHEWLAEVTLTQAAHRLDGPQLLFVLARALEGRALAWWRSLAPADRPTDPQLLVSALVDQFWTATLSRRAAELAALRLAAGATTIEWSTFTRQYATLLAVVAPGQVPQLAIRGLLQGVSPAVQTFVLQRHPTTLADAIRFGTLYHDALDAQRALLPPSFSDAGTSAIQTSTVTPRGLGTNRSTDRFRGECHYCHKIGHRQAECRSRRRDMAHLNNQQGGSSSKPDQGQQLKSQTSGSTADNKARLKGNAAAIEPAEPDFP
jgi:hypothetical protein